MWVEPRTTLPRHQTLVERLRTHHQLRDILSDRNREVVLADINSHTEEALVFIYPDLEEVFEGQLDVDMYPESDAKLVILRNPERYDSPSRDEGRPEGILIKGRRAVYENTLFGFEGNAHAGWFSGSVVCEFVDVLAGDYDDRLDGAALTDARNPMPIITRDRDGLERAHPFYKKLKDAVETKLGQFVRQEEEKAKGHRTVSATLQRALEFLGRDIGRLIDEDLKEIEEEGLPTSENGDKPELAFRVVPEHVVAYMAEDKTLSAIAPKSMGLTETLVYADPEGVVEFLDGPILQFADHRSKRDLVSTQLRIRPLAEGEQTVSSFTANGAKALSLVEVRSEREFEGLREPPGEFEFERERYQAQWQKPKHLRFTRRSKRQILAAPLLGSHQMILVSWYWEVQSTCLSTRSWSHTWAK